ncbi:MAG: hypothetical protein EAZ08_06355 [Cytophagales bacterium]|nr:MAG: hypothetical protein EAZ08_06355 [Cytophagales bacterium]
MVPNKLLLFIFITFFIALSQRALSQVITLTSTNKSVLAGKYFDIYQDSTNLLTAAQISSDEYTNKFSKSNRSIPTFPVTSATVWVKVQVENKAEEPAFLSVENAFIDTVALYKFNNGAWEAIKTGFLPAFGSRQIHKNNYLFPLGQTQGIQTYYLKCRTASPMFIPMYISAVKPLIERTHQTDLFFGIYIGIIIFAILYNAFVFFTVRELYYLYYIIGTFFIAVFYLTLEGYAYEWLWQEGINFNYYAPIIVGISNIAILIFTINFLKLKENFRKIYITHLVLLCFFGLNVFINIFVSRPLSDLIAQLLSLILCLLLLSASIYVYFKGVKIARFYFLAWGQFLILTIVLIVQLNTEVSPSIWIAKSHIIGSALETILLSLALADRINMLKKQNEENQKQIIEQLQENQVLQTKVNRELEEKVAERTQEIKDALLLIQEKNEELTIYNEEISQQTEEIQAQRDAIEESRKVLEDRNRNITSSINYALRIQKAILPSKGKLDGLFGEGNYFILYKPRDIVSGDFYFSEIIDGKEVIVAADCTGHGVPGAFMSIVGMNVLEELVKFERITSPDLILNRLHLRIREFLNQQDTNNSDGMDISVCTIDRKAKQVEYAGAKNHLYYIQDGALQVVKADKMTIGGKQEENERIFTKQTIAITSETILYLFSDGFQDQFGGVEGRKFMTNRFKELLFENYQKSLQAQQQVLATTIENWIGFRNNQTDDIMVIGVKITT